MSAMGKDTDITWKAFGAIAMAKDAEIMGIVYRNGTEISSKGKEILFKGDAVMKATAKDVDGGTHEISATLHNEEMAGIDKNTKVTMGKSDRFVLKEDLVFMGKTYEAGTLMDVKDGSLVKTESMDKLRFSEMQERGKKGAVSGGNYYEVIEKDSKGNIVRQFNVPEATAGDDIYGDGVFEEKGGLLTRIWNVGTRSAVEVQLKDGSGKDIGKTKTVYMQKRDMYVLEKLDSKASFVKARVYTSLFASKEVFVPVKSLYSEQYGKGAINFRMVDVLDENGNITGRYSMAQKDFETLSGTSSRERYLQFGDEVAASRIEGASSLGELAGDIAKSWIFEARSAGRIMLGSVFLGGEVHSASFVGNTKIYKGFTTGHLLALGTDIALIWLGGGLSIGLNILKGAGNMGRSFLKLPAPRVRGTR